MPLYLCEMQRHELDSDSWEVKHLSSGTDNVLACQLLDVAQLQLDVSYVILHPRRNPRMLEILEDC
jgi:hypothetical protein